MPLWFAKRPAAVLLVFLAAGPAEPYDSSPAYVPGRGEALHYAAEWRFIHAGDARLSWSPGAPATPGWQARMHLESVGLVSKLFKVDDVYLSLHNDSLCTTSSMLTAREGSRFRETKVTYDLDRRKASYLERDIKKGAVVRAQEIDIPPCIHDVIGALWQLRAMRVGAGKTVQIPVTDGKKSVLAKVEAQEQETVTTPAGQFQTIRYEVFLFGGVLYQRPGRLFLWLSDDDRRLPVQIRVRLQLYIGTITLQLVKVETS